MASFLGHSDQCLIPSSQIAFCFTNLSCVVLEIFRFFKKHAQNLNTPQNNSASWDLQMGFNLAFKGLNRQTSQTLMYDPLHLPRMLAAIIDMVPLLFFQF